jgi:uncharacterized protein (DUF433 family)
MTDWRERISVNPAVCHGKGCIPVLAFSFLVLDNIAAGISRDEILRGYPPVELADIDAALAYAAELTREGSVDRPSEIKV